MVFHYGSNRIYKLEANTTNNNLEEENGNTTNSKNEAEENATVQVETATKNIEKYAYYDMGSNVKFINNKLYITSNDIQKACNISFAYDQEEQIITIYTVPYLSEYYASIISDYGFTGISDIYENQKIILKNMLVVKRGDNYGVLSIADGTFENYILGTRYQEIIYNEILDEFIVTSNNQKGIIGIDGVQKISVNYNDIELINAEQQIYCVEKDGFKGVVDSNEKILINIEYNDIGVDDKLYPVGHVDNRMLFFNNCVPVMKDNKWGILDIQGNVILSVQYDGLGFINTLQGKSVNNTILVPEIEGVVMCQNGKYGIIDKQGEIRVLPQFDAVYYITTGGEDIYYLEYNGQAERLSVVLSRVS